jgi:hypothetical protein
MNDDWRLRIDVRERELASELAEQLRAHELERDLERSLNDQVVVSVDDHEVFCYAGTREQADHAREVIQALADERRWELDFELRHWHPTAERWEDADKPLPQNDAELADERRERVAQERQDSAAQGYPEFEVRIQCASHADAGRLAERLRGEGMPIVQRWSYVLVGALDEDSAAALAQRLKAGAPEGCQVTVEGNLRAVYNERPWHMFSVLGGIAG